MSEYKIQALGNYPEENIQHTEHGKSLKSRMIMTCLFLQKSHVPAILWFHHMLCYNEGQRD
jgi:hypothetical protein